MSRWYVVNTRVRQEERAVANLRRQGFDVWLPQIRRTRRHARRVERVPAPLFPGYLFVRLDLAVQSWRSINGTFGVVHLLCHGDAPLAVPDGVMESINARVDEAGFVALAPPTLARGQAVMVKDGPFRGVEGLFEEMAGRDRVVLLMELLGRRVRAAVPVQALVA